MQKIFIANVTTQVVERHIVRGLENIFSPVFVSRLSNAEAEKIASEPPAHQRQRNFLEDQAKKLDEGRSILRSGIGSAEI